jgi:excisionase family DNA binding protein
VKIFSALEVANICGVVNQTAINWIKNGYLKAFTTPGGQYRIYAKDLAAFLDTRGMADSGEALQVLLERSNWNNILIAPSDPVLNSRLKDEIITAFPDYSVAQAFDAFDMGFRLAQDKPGLILLDGELPGIDHDKVIQLLKADPVFGKPCIFFIGDSSLPGAMVDKIFSNPPNADAVYRAIKDLEKQIEATA